VQAVDDVAAQLAIGFLYQGRGVTRGFFINQKIGKIKRHGGVQGLTVNENLACKKLQRRLWQRGVKLNS
jgi:hypothetical protein